MASTSTSRLGRRGGPEQLLYRTRSNVLTPPRRRRSSGTRHLSGWYWRLSTRFGIPKQKKGEGVGVALQPFRACLIEQLAEAASVKYVNRPGA